MKQIAGREPQLPSTAIHLHQHQSLWAATNALNSPVHIAPHERISGGMCLHTLADCEVVCGVVGVEGWDRVRTASAIDTLPDG
jgi:hypothetical protein